MQDFIQYSIYWFMCGLFIYMLSLLSVGFFSHPLEGKKSVNKIFCPLWRWNQTSPSLNPFLIQHHQWDSHGFDDSHLPQIYLCNSALCCSKRLEYKATSQTSRYNRFWKIILTKNKSYDKYISIQSQKYTTSHSYSSTRGFKCVVLSVKVHLAVVFPRLRW